MKRVAIFRSKLLAPSETFIRDQARALTAWHPVLVGFEDHAQGIPTPGIPREIVPRSNNSLLCASQFWFSHPIPQLVQRLKQLSVGLVHAHFATDATDVWPSVKALGLPMLVTLHGYDINIHREWWQAGHGGLRRRVYPDRLLRMSREPNVRFIAVSYAIRQRAIEYGIPEEKIVVAYIGVDVKRLKPGSIPLNQRQRRIIFVGRMVEKKAPLLMVRAFSEVRKKFQDAELVMVGDGPLLCDAKLLAQKLGAPVNFLGARTSEEVAAEMHQARVLCLPSVIAQNGDAEGFGLVLLEAQACGVPVVTSALGGSSEGVLQGKTGYVCKPGSISDIVCGLLQFMSDVERPTITLSDVSRFASEHFDIRHLTKQLELAYDNLFEGMKKNDINDHGHQRKNISAL